MQATRWTITHDFMYLLGGAERVTAAIAQQVLEEAPILCLGYTEDVVRTLGIEGRVLAAPGILSRHVNARNYKVIASLLGPTLSCVPPIEGNLLASSYAFSHHFRPTGKMVVYCHSPMRQVWSGAVDYAAQFPLPVQPIFRGMTGALRYLDRKAMERANYIVSSGPVVSQRVRTYYGREPALELSPPVNTNLFQPQGDPSDYYLWAGRIVEPYKRVGLLLEAFNDSGRRLIIAGDGRDKAALQSRASSNISFIGAVSTAELARLMARARAFVFPSADDFGMAPVEAMACGTPVVAFRGGGAAHTVREGLTGLFFEDPEPIQLRRALDLHEAMIWDRERIRNHALQFSMPYFVSKLKAFLDDVGDPSTDG